MPWSVTPDSGYALIATVSDPNMSKYTDASAAAGAKYYYKIAIFGVYNNQTIYGDASAAVAVSLPLPAAVALAKPLFE